MTINCIDERVKIIRKLWNREHDSHVVDILLKQLNNDITYFCSERLPYELQIQIDKLTEEIHRYDNH